MLPNIYNIYAIQYIDRQDRTVSLHFTSSLSGNWSIENNQEHRWAIKIKYDIKIRIIICF